MKKIYTIVLSSLTLLAGACSDWLDVRPSDTLVQEELFAKGDGYRVALNGVYRQMSESSLYGQSLTWAYLDIAAQIYSVWDFGYGTTERKFSEYAYTDKDIEPIIDRIWSGCYNSIANCNNILANIDAEPASKFRGGEEEKQLIKGEALALRAFLHLDILRLFAPAPVNDDGKDYVPYVNTYPCTFKESVPNKEVLALVIADLQAAKDLVRPFDTDDEHLAWMTTNARIENFAGLGTGNPPSDIFFTYRGYRMNYYAICATLARAYNYAGHYDAGNYKKAFDETQPVIDGNYEGNPYFAFSTQGVSSGNMKLYNDLIFCLSNQETLNFYATANSGNSKFYVDGVDMLYDDVSDIRLSGLLEPANYFYYESLKYSDKCNTYCADMIPMLRLSEMYYIRAEYYNSIGESLLAAGELDKVREGRNCSIGKYPPLIEANPSGWFKDELLDEAHREFIGEGQLFFYYKRLGMVPVSGANLVFPLPDSESGI